MSETPETDMFITAAGYVRTEHQWRTFARKLERERDEARTELDMWRDGNILHENHRDELEKAERERNEAIQERERWKMQAEQKWGMRRELEELLGVKDTESEEQFAKGVAALRDLIQERDEARDLSAALLLKGNILTAQ